MLGAKVSPSLLLATGLMATAAVNVLFGFSSNLVMFCVLWAVNGILQVCQAGCVAVSVMCTCLACLHCTAWRPGGPIHQAAMFITTVVETHGLCDNVCGIPTVSESL